ncbi:DSD1 family PLP-dependent enzyme [Sphingosinicella rhizophila]|uniref:DSD1 family PLP-dependent enzyme n=1 Tax=Sphingosinicella rhizophila TaxID=3050082 RepID=A0ABU3Q493_9SPHN|nr:DSD1 family PLP-dependent enzyme [Sphingosinicella sp. GR2756]MDT9598237.1 DSD1 family PLP-dependent enzyme [Sphingosinicella sp. GR2756]
MLDTLTRNLSQTTSIEDLETPCLVLNRSKVERNIARLNGHLWALGVALRPHLKTCKSIEVARLAMPGAYGPAAVSTLKEAEQFAAAGVRDILYAVGIAPQKLPRVQALRSAGTDLSIILDSVEQAEAVAAASAGGDPIPVLIEIDSDGHRAGIRPEDREMLTAVGRAVHEGGAELRGVLTHAGESYHCKGIAALEAMAEQERAAAVSCAATLRDAGLPCPVVSVGSTPTAHFARDLTGVTEVRAGVYIFFDLVMAGIGVCKIEDIALAVLATVVGRRPDRNLLIIDAGWMALSRDRGTAGQEVDQGYGLVCDLDGIPYPDLVVVDTNQEHGVVSLRAGSSASLPDLPIGAHILILPNHACATASQHDCYHVVDAAGTPVSAICPRFGGW